MSHILDDTFFWYFIIQIKILVISDIVFLSFQPLRHLVLFWENVPTANNHFIHQ